MADVCVFCCWGVVLRNPVLVDLVSIALLQLKFSCGLNFYGTEYIIHYNTGTVS